MKRRELLLASVAGAAALAGFGIADWRARLRPPHAVVAGNGASDFWASTFLTPSGAALPVSRFAGRPLLVNFWATWCVPCVTEMPLLDAFAKAQPATGFRVLALAIDDAAAVARFLAERSLQLDVGLAGGVGIDLSRSLGNSVGALPFSVAFASNGSPADRKLGALTEAALARWVEQVH